MLYPVPIRNDQPCLGAFTFAVEPGADGKHQATNKIGAFAKGQAVTGIRIVITEQFTADTDLEFSVGLGAYTAAGVTTAAQPTFFSAASAVDGAVGTAYVAFDSLKLIPDFDGESVDLTLTLSDASGNHAPSTWTTGKLKGVVTVIDQI